VIELDPDRIAAEAGAAILQRGGGGRPERATIDSRDVRPGDLFVGLPGANVDGGRFAAGALGQGAWGVLVGGGWAAELASPGDTAGWIFAAEDPLAALQSLARAWRRRIGCPLVGITGSTGKTTAKDITRSILPRRVHASPENFNTEIGMPLALLSAPPETEVLVMEMAMRGSGQIAELCAIAEPDVAAITNVGPVHLGLLGSVEAIAAAKAEILSGLSAEGRAVVPAGSGPLGPHLGGDLATTTFGSGGDVHAIGPRVIDGRMETMVSTPLGEARFEFGFEENYNLTNALCAIAIGASLGIEPEEMTPLTSRIQFSRLRGERVELQREILLLNDCYNANPISMRAAIEHLASVPARRRHVGILGGMAELGPDAPRFHAEAAARARELGVEPIIGIGELARDYEPDEWAPDPLAGAELAERILGPGDVVLVKGSRSVGLEALTDALRARLGEAGG